MPIQDAYPNTPGFVAQIKDGGLKIVTPPQTLSQSVLLLGVATDGPVNTPIQITSLTQAQTLFGTTNAATNYSTMGTVAKSLTRGMYELLQAGCTDIRLCRVGGVSASYLLTDTTVANSVTLAAGYPGVKYDALKVSVTAATAMVPGTITITTLDNVAHNFAYTTTSVYGDLINAINLSNINVTASQLNPAASPTALITLTTTASAPFTNGTDGTSPTDAQYNTALNAAYTVIESYAVSCVVPLGAYLQPTFALDTMSNPTVANANLGDTVSFGQNLAQFVARVSVNASSCFGVISIAPLLVPTFVNSVNRGRQLALTAYSFKYATGYVDAANSLPFAGAVGTDGLPFDTGYLLQILAGPDPVVNNSIIGNYVMDGAATYAGKVCSLAPQSGATNKVIAPIISLSYNYGASVIDNLTAQRFVVFSTSNGAVRTVADQTYGFVGSDFAKLSTLRITYASMEAVRSATAGFIGEANTPAATNSMGTAVNSALTSLKNAGALIDYSYTINASSADQINGNVNVSLVLIPALQIRKIYVTISLKPPSSVNA